MSFHGHDTKYSSIPDRLKGFQTIAAPHAVQTEMYCQHMSDFTNTATYQNRSEYRQQFSNEELFISYNDALIEQMGKHVTADIPKDVDGNLECRNSLTQVKFIMWQY